MKHVKSTLAIKTVFLSVIASSLLIADERPNVILCMADDLGVDPSETQNIASQHPAIVNRMRDRLQTWQASCQSSAAGADY